MNILFCLDVESRDIDDLKRYYEEQIELVKVDQLFLSFYLEV